MSISENKAIQYYQLAYQMAEIFSKDPSCRVGCILLAPRSYQILSMGYNGMPRSINENIPERWIRPTKYQLIEHAERNALYNACRHGTPLEGSLAVITMFPCFDCARGLIQSGINTVISHQPEHKRARWGETWKVARGLLEEAGIEIILLPSETLEKPLDIKVKIPPELLTTEHMNSQYH